MAVVVQAVSGCERLMSMGVRRRADRIPKNTTTDCRLLRPLNASQHKWHSDQKTLPKRSRPMGLFMHRLLQVKKFDQCTMLVRSSSRSYTITDSRLNW